MRLPKFLKIAFVCDGSVCVCAPEGIHVNGPCMTGWTSSKVSLHNSSTLSES